MDEYTREELRELVEHLDKYERCKNCYHLTACDPWVRNGTTFYDDYGYSVEDCPYYVPTADVVEVVRCKDCKYLEIKLPYGECGRYLRMVSPDDYCSCGAKMDGKGEGE